VVEIPGKGARTRGALMFTIPAILALAKANWKLIAIGGAILALFTWHKLEVRSAYNRAVADVRAAAIVEANKRNAERDKNNAEFRKLPARDRCRVIMRDSGLPDSGCD